MTKPTVSFWLPAAVSDERVITSADLREFDDYDQVDLFVSGELTAQFRVPKGLGPAVLRDCGLERQ